MPDGAAWPRVTVVTPSFQQAAFLEECIRSVLMQGYPALEYIVLDGGSSDGSVEIIRRYAPWLHYWRSAPDGGQASAIAEGWDRGSGEIVAFLNSDDAYVPGALHAAARALSQSTHLAGVCGAELRMDAGGRILRVERPADASLDALLRFQHLPQPATFLRARAAAAAGGVSSRYPTIFDYELWLRVAAAGEIGVIPRVLAATREHPARLSRTQREQIARELTSLRRELGAGRLLRLSHRWRRRASSSLAYGIASIRADVLPRGAARTAWLLLAALVRQPRLLARLYRDVRKRVRRSEAERRPDGLIGADAAQRGALSDWTVEMTTNPPL